MTEPTPAGWRSEWYDRIAAAAEAAAKSGLTPQEAMAGADFVFSAYWQSERGEDFHRGRVVVDEIADGGLGQGLGGDGRVRGSERVGHDRPPWA